MNQPIDADARRVVFAGVLIVCCGGQVVCWEACQGRSTTSRYVICVDLVVGSESDLLELRIKWAFVRIGNVRDAALPVFYGFR